VLQTVYTNASIATPTVSYTYDATYRRIASMVDGIGTTSYTYKAVGTLGAGQVATVDGPLTNDTITYTYDELGHVTNRDINGTGVTWAFDTLGRTTSEVNVLGTFAYTYDGTTNRLATVTYPSNQTSTYSYFGNTQDHRLQTIHHKYPNQATLSKFDYTYDALGNILTWRQQADSTAVLWKYTYDVADQLQSAIMESTATPPVVLERFAYTYDLAGNRTSAQIDDSVVQATHDNLNRLLTHSAGGPLRFVGSTNELATVTIQGQPATVDASNVFRGTAPTTSGTNTVTITATDPTGNQRMQQYQVTQSSASKTFTYDANGNMTSDGLRTFEWDASNRLTTVVNGTKRLELGYYGTSRLAKLVQKDNGVVQQVNNEIWCESALCEERANDHAVVVRRVFREGEQVIGASRFTFIDHLASTKTVTDGVANVLARYELDPWGARTLVAGTDATTVGYAAYRADVSSGLSFALFRPYDESFGRWITEDPIGLSGGVNLYEYVRGNPIKWVDVSGLEPRTPGSPVPANIPQYPADKNGNWTPKTFEQDMRCTFGRLGAWMDTKSCLLDCCQKHDHVM
jgi:RHS repeat-associated protein